MEHFVIANLFGENVDPVMTVVYISILIVVGRILWKVSPLIFRFITAAGNIANISSSPHSPNYNKHKTMYTLGAVAIAVIAAVLFVQYVIPIIIVLVMVAFIIKFFL